MAILYVDGFDYFTDQTPADFNGRWQTGGLTNTYLAVTTGLRNGHGRALRISGSSSMTRVVSAEITTMFFAFAFLYTGSPASDIDIAVIRSSGNLMLTFEITSSGNIVVKRSGLSVIATGTATLNNNTWYHLSFKVVASATVGSVDMHINGSATPDIAATNQNTLPSGTGYDTFGLAGNNIFNTFDDLVVADATGGQTIIPDLDVYTIFPDGAGASAQFTPSAGSNWQNVDENPNDGDTTYNESQTLGHKDRFTAQNVPANTDTIYAVQVGAFAKKTDVGAREINVLAYDGTTEGAGPDIGVGTAYEWALGLFEDHPSGAAAWTEGEVNSGEFGYEVAV